MAIQTIFPILFCQLLLLRLNQMRTGIIKLTVETKNALYMVYRKVRFSDKPKFIFIYLTL